MEFFDSHTHYQDDAFKEDIDNVLKKTYEQGVTKVVIPGWDIVSSKKAIEIANKNEFCYAAIGVHPSDVKENLDLSELYKMAENKKVVAIGEIGLDYHYENYNKELQKEYFIKQIKIANELELPIIIHNRESNVDSLQIVKENVCKKKGIFHCCPHNIELIKEILKQDYYVSFAGPITFKNAKNAYEAVKMVPLEKLLKETDSPYLSPEPNRGKRNNSTNVKFVAQKIAQIKEISLEEIAEITYENARKVFDI